MRELTCEMFEDEASEYLDGELAGDGRAAMEAHAARCGSCTALLADLRRIVADARALPVLAPTRDPWDGIETRIQASVIPLAEGAGAPARRGRRTWQFSTPWLAAAAAALILVSSAVTYLVTASDDVIASAPVAAAETWVITGGERAVMPAASTSDPAATRYDEEIRSLRAAIAERRGLLDSTTVATIERSLRIIDDAIAESRAAMARDPGNDFLHEQLDRTLARKLELLRALARMPVRS